MRLPILALRVGLEKISTVLYPRLGVHPSNRQQNYQDQLRKEESVRAGRRLLPGNQRAQFFQCFAAFQPGRLRSQQKRNLFVRGHLRQ